MSDVFVSVFMSLLGTSLFEIPKSYAQECRPVTGVRQTGVDYTLDVLANELKFMQYNVENLFDTEHDASHEDFEFLPLAHAQKAQCLQISNRRYREKCSTTDWKPANLTVKLEQIKRAIQAQGSLPSILTLSEIENESVTQMLANVLGYNHFVISHGADGRGINVAVLYNDRRLTKIGVEEFPVGVGDPNFVGRPSRNILAVYFHVDGFPNLVLGVYSNHWPSQANPVMNRVIAGQRLKEAISRDRARFGTAHFHAIAAGDFNVIPSDNPNPLDQLSQAQMQDAQTLYETGAHRRDSKQMLGLMPPGSYFYRNDMTWNQLDRIYLSDSLLDQQGLDAMAETFRIVGADSISRPYRERPTCPEISVPAESNHNGETSMQAGYSDHYPVVLKLKLPGRSPQRARGLR